MTERDDERMKERFQALRAETRGSGAVPDFDTMLAEAKLAGQRPALEVVSGGESPERVRGRRWLRAGAWASAAVAAGLVGLVLVDRGPSGEDEFERLVAAYTSQGGAESWRSPTSGLLEVPGMDLMRTVPSIGGAARGVDPSTLPAPQPSPEEETL